MPTIQEVIRQFESDLDELLDSATRQLTESYGAIYLRLRREADALVEAIEQMRKAGEEITLNRLRNMERYKRLVREVKEEMDKYAVVVEDAIRRNGPGAALRGAAEARAMVEARLAGYPPQVQASILATFQQLPRQALIDMVGALQEGSPLSRLLAEFGEEAAKRIGDGLLHGLAAGYSPRKVARELQQQAGLSLTRALRISRTEMIRAHRMANLATYRANEHVVRGWRWHAQMDERTCMSCVAMHGTLHSLDETLDDHPNGRCAAIPETVSFRDLGIDLDDPDPVVKEGDGERWFMQQPEDVQRRMMGEDKWRAWKEGKFTFPELSKVHDDPEWGRMFTEASLRDLLGEG